MASAEFDIITKLTEQTRTAIDALIAQAVRAERERIRRLAVDHDATCQNLAEPSGWGPFATLIERGPDD